MTYIIVGLCIIIVLLVVLNVNLRHAIHKTTQQMTELEKTPKSNRQLKSYTTNHQVEQLLTKINELYQIRQQERIIYQRRETQIRHEIENISHDLRTPLTSIIGYVNLIQDEQTSEPEKKEYLQIINKRAKVLQGFIQDFYEISRIEAEDYPIIFDTVQVQNMISEAAVAYYNEFLNKQIEVQVDLEEKLCLIIADKIQFNRILNNLLQNALKYAKCLFVIKQYTVNGQCIIQFKNDKNQMNEEQLKLIFDRFYTGDSSRSNQSTGLGLTITKMLVEKMKGTIEAKIEGNMFIMEVHFPI